MRRMRGVWILGSGEYSGYQVHAAFTERELAEAACRLHDEIRGDYDKGKVGQMTMWLFDREAAPAYRISQWFRDGIELGPDKNSRALVEESIAEWDLRASGECRTYLDSWVHPTDRAKSGPRWELRVEGTHRERVLKVFSEKRAQLKAMPWMTMDDAEVHAAIVDPGVWLEEEET